MLSGNVFTTTVTFLPADFGNPVPIATLQCPNNGTVGGQLTYVMFDTDGTDTESAAGLVIFNVTITAGAITKDIDGGTLVVKSGSDSGSTPNWAIDDSGPLPVITATISPDLTVDSVALSFAINYYGGTWGGGEFPTP